MLSVYLLRVLFVFVCTVIGYSLGEELNFVYATIAFSIGMIIVLLETFARKISLKGLSSSVFGIILGLILAKLFGGAMDLFVIPGEIAAMIKKYLLFIFVYLGLTLGIKGRSEFNLIIPYVKFRRQEIKEEAVVMDTSSIIDGRVLDIVKTRFLEARFIVPRFVLNELHALADSTDHMKRQKGKRGIEILHTLKKEDNVDVVISDEEVKEVKSVDEKVVRLAQDLDAKILTTDYNLNRIAQLQGVVVLNINDLANALKPTFISGERFSLKLMKEGKEHNQAIGYLEDGTMVVVENAIRLIGKVVNIEVSSVLQSPSGRIVFTKLV